MGSTLGPLAAIFKCPGFVLSPPSFELGDGDKREPSAPNQLYLGPHMPVKELVRDAERCRRLGRDAQSNPGHGSEIQAATSPVCQNP
jgi:hypothetical protein